MKHRCSPAVTCMVLTALICTLALPGPDVARAECDEVRIIEYEDRVEAVCVGEHLTEEQKKEKLEEERKQDLEAKRIRDEQLRLLKTLTEKRRGDTEPEKDNKTEQTVDD